MPDVEPKALVRVGVVVGVHREDQRVAAVAFRRDQTELEPVLIDMDRIPNAAREVDPELAGRGGRHADLGKARHSSLDGSFVDFEDLDERPAKKLVMCPTTAG